MMVRAMSYKHDCECFDDINAHMLIPGITGIVQEYLHSIDAAYIRSVLRPLIYLRYSSTDDYTFSLGKKRMSGRVVWPYSSSTYVSIKLNIDPERGYRTVVSPSRCTMEISISFSQPVCLSTQCNRLAGHEIKMQMILTGNTIGSTINTALSRDWREELISLIIKNNRYIPEKHIRSLISTDLFDAACEMFRRRIAREIYSKYHVDQQIEAEAMVENHYDIPDM